MQGTTTSLFNDQTGISVEVVTIAGGFAVNVKLPDEPKYIVFRRYAERERAMETAREVVMGSQKV